MTQRQVDLRIAIVAIVALVAVGVVAALVEHQHDYAMCRHIVVETAARHGVAASEPMVADACGWSL
jgi:hypothetical protein